MINLLIFDNTQIFVDKIFLYFFLFLDIIFYIYRNLTELSCNHFLAIKSLKTMNSAGSNCENSKYQRSTPSGCKDKKGLQPDEISKIYENLSLLQKLSF